MLVVMKAACRVAAGFLSAADDSLGVQHMAACVSTAAVDCDATCEIKPCIMQCTTNLHRYWDDLK